MRDGRQQVVILYSHPLLGEGLGRLLAADPALAVELIQVGDLDQARQALVDSPDVVILERTPPVQAIDLMRLAPSALLIDVGLDAGPTWTWRRDEVASQPEELLRLIHGREGHEEACPAPAAAAAIAAPSEPPPPRDAAAATRVMTALRSAGA